MVAYRRSEIQQEDLMTKINVTLRRVQKILATITLILGILGTLQNLWTGWPIKSLWIFHNHKIIDISNVDPSLFRINEIKTYNNRFLDVGDKFSYKSILPFWHTDIPISISGSTSFTGSTNIWVVCRDRHGLYYLQCPKVYMRNMQLREWIHESVYPRDEITLIIFVSLDSDGNEIFKKREISEDYSGFKTLPADWKEIASIRLERYFN